jgi:tetratricopeptide (TPR) repeat protein
VARRPDSKAATETLQEIESVFDRMASWVAENPARFFAMVGIVLAAAAAIGLNSWWSNRREAVASTALARVEADFRIAMGAAPGSAEIPEPANPEMGRAARVETVELLLDVGEEHAGTVSALRALLGAGNLQEETGDLEGAIATWRAAVAAAPAGSAIRGLLLTRLGHGLESAGDWEGAGEVHAEAAEIEDYPARYYAMADAARCFAQAGDAQRAVALFDRLESEAQELQLSDHVRARLREAQAGAF